MEFLKEGIIKTYAILKTEGNLSYIKHLDVERIDFCEFGNSVPFRIRIKNMVNDNYDHYYIKAADASRIYGLELEHLLSPNRITFFCHKNTLVEEHIPGIPGDVFLQDYLQLPETNKIRIAKEFVKFNERCFARLLGDMRNYNFVVDITPDIEDYQYRLRAIDFDQQCYEGKKNLYLPQFYKENFDYVELVLKNLSPDVIEQYQTEERTAMAYRVIASRRQLMELLNIMIKDELSENYKTKQLREELNEHFKNTYFSTCKTMGAILKRQLKQMLQKHLKQVQHT
jgi:DNA replication protein DnaD